MCAERVAIANAISTPSTQDTDGAKFEIAQIAIAVVDNAGVPLPVAFMPCGACREVALEFAAPDAEILVDGVGRFKLDELLPHAF